MKETEKTQRLLDKFYDGQTTEAEEAELRSLLEGGDAADGFSADRQLFSALHPDEKEVPDGLEEQLDRQINQWNTVETTAHRRNRRVNMRWMAAIAAMMLLLFGVGAIVWNHERTPEYTQPNTYDDPEEAYAETSRALMKFSKALNKGIEETEKAARKHKDQS